MDFDLAVRAYLLGNITYYDSLVSRYRIHSSSKTNDHHSFVEDWRLVFSRFVNTFPAFSSWRQLFVDHGLHSDLQLHILRHVIFLMPTLSRFFFNIF